MRKWVVLVIIAGLFVSFITKSRAAVDGILLGDSSRKNLLYQSLKNEKSLAILNKIIVLPDHKYNQKEAASIINRLDSLPSSLLKRINNQGITVKLFSGKLTDNPSARYLAGKTPRGYPSNTTWDDVPGIGGSKVVLVKIGASEKGKGHDSVNLELHELAHSVDRYILNEVSSSKEFYAVWKQEHDQLFPGNSYFLYPEEYFAETFAMYFLNAESKKQLKEKAPATYNFIETLW